jgi:hypothetical protein
MTSSGLDHVRSKYHLHRLVPLDRTEFQRPRHFVRTATNTHGPSEFGAEAPRGESTADRSLCQRGQGCASTTVAPARPRATVTANNNADHVLVQIMVAGHRSLLVWVETDAGQDVPVHGCHPVVPVDLKLPHWAAPVTLPAWPSTSAWIPTRGARAGPGPGRPGVAPRACLAAAASCQCQ